LPCSRSLEKVSATLRMRSAIGAAAADLPGVARHGLCRCNEEADEIAAAPAAANVWREASNGMPRLRDTVPWAVPVSERKCEEKVEGLVSFCEPPREETTGDKRSP
jgi:hypothetical protein